MLRSIGVVLLGFFVIGALAVGADYVVRYFAPEVFDASGAVRSVPVLLLMQVYVALFATFGCYLAARLAPSRPMAHAMALGVLGLVFNVVNTVALWNTAPAWYHVLALALVLPYAWLGGRIRERELARAGHTGRLAAA